MADRPRILILEGPAQSAGNLLDQCTSECELVRVDSLDQGLPLLRTQKFDGVFADTRDSAVRQWAGNLLQSERILEALPAKHREQFVEDLLAIVDTLQGLSPQS